MAFWVCLNIWYQPLDILFDNKRESSGGCVRNNIWKTFGFYLINKMNW